MKKSQFLPVYEQNFLADNGQLLAKVQNGQAPLRHVLAFCANFRRAAIASLLQTARSPLFRKRLQRSGAAFAHFLQQAAHETKKTSASMPYLDALAAGDFDTATVIAQLSRRDWRSDEEYEEDFLFYEVLMQHGSLGADDGTVSGLIDRWEQCLAGTVDERLEVCRALVRRDAAAFEKALKKWLRVRASDFRDRRSELEDEVLATEASVSIEGVAIARLAVRNGLPLVQDYPQIPSTARDDAPLAWSARSFTDLS